MNLTSKIWICLMVLVTGLYQTAHAQNNQKTDSIKIARQQQKSIDSVKKVAAALELQKRKDSIQVARQQKKIKDSLNLVQRKKDIKDSLELEQIKRKFGEEKYQEKLDEKARIKKMEARFEKQRIEDSIFLAKKQKEQIKKDTITKNDKPIVKEDSILVTPSPPPLTDSTITKKKTLSLPWKQGKTKSVKDTLQTKTKEVEKKEVEILKKDTLAENKKRNKKNVVKTKQTQTDKKEKRKEPLKENPESITRVDSTLITSENKMRTTDTTGWTQEQKSKYNDSLANIERIRKMEAKYAQQRLEDSIRLAKMKADSLAKIVVITRDTIDMDVNIPTDTIKKDSIKIAILDTTFKENLTLNIDSLRKIDSLKYYFNSYRYRLKKAVELGLYYGISNYLGDLGGNSGFGKKYFYDNNFKKRNTFWGASLTYTYKEYLGIRFSYTNGKLSASDHDIAFENKKDPAYLRYKRNLDFQTKISEWALIAEFNPLKLLPVSNRWFKYHFQPYTLLGIGRYTFNPQGSYYDEIVEDYIYIDLAGLRTEGQGMEEYPEREMYKMKQWNIPFGIGVRYCFNRRSSIGFEFLGRKLFTDYLDDVSTNFIDPSLYTKYLDEENAEIARQVNNKSHEVDPDAYYDSGEIRGNPKNNDFYYSFNIKFSYRLNKLVKPIKLKSN